MFWGDLWFGHFPEKNTTIPKVTVPFRTAGFLSECLRFQPPKDPFKKGIYTQ